MAIGWTLAVLAPGSVAAQEVKATLTTIHQEILQLAASVEGARQDLVVVQRTQAQTKATVEELQTGVQMVDAKLEEYNHRLGELAQRLETLEASGSLSRRSLAPPSAPTKSSGPLPSWPGAAEPPPATATAAPPPSQAGSPIAPQRIEVASLAPKEIFRAALEDYIKGNYDLAILGFRDYLKKYPGTVLASNTYYWLGECYMGKEDHAQAVKEFQQLMDAYPKSPKVPSALFKQGIAYLDLGEMDKARAVLESLTSRFPTTVEARQASERLKSLSSP